MKCYLLFAENAARTAAIFVCVALLAACGTGQDADDTEAPQATVTSADPIERGERSFMAYCASCHGSDGTGTGPVAEVMTTNPADLTQLRARYGGTFPADSVYAYIDGREDVQAHGTREMPVWGNVWGEEDGEPVDRDEVDLRIRELVEYIRTLQEEPDAS